MKNSEILINALNLIDVPGKWTQGVCARDDEGDKVAANSKNAHCFCSVGAVLHQDPTDLALVHSRAIDMLHSVAGQLGYVDAAYLNDAASDQFSDDMSVMWMTAIFNALADESK